MQINEMLEEYYRLKERQKRLNAQIDTMNKEIKDYMITNETDKLEAENYKADLKKQEKTTWVEPILIEKLKKIGYNELIKTKEYVDYDLMEKYIYTNQLKITKVKDCMNKIEILTLRVSEVKK